MSAAFDGASTDALLLAQLRTLNSGHVVFDGSSDLNLLSEDTPSVQAHVKMNNIKVPEFTCKSDLI